MAVYANSGAITIRGAGRPILLACLEMARRRSLLGKLLLGAAVLAALSVLFFRTLQETSSAPYRVHAEQLTGWRLTLDPAAGFGGPVLALEPPRELTLDLFQQIFERTMESMSPPAVHAVTLVHRAEFDNALAGVIEPGELLALAREAGLESARVEPRCLAVRPGRAAGEPGRTFFALFDLPEMQAFRARVGKLAAERGGAATFDPPAARAVVHLAATDVGFRSWPAPEAAAEQHCSAPLEAAPAS